MSRWQRIVDAIFGYDYFISYAWSDGERYAAKLYEALRDSGFECFLDRSRFRIGDDWRKIGAWTLRRTANLIVVGSPAAVKSKAVRYEVETFQRHGNRVAPIDFGGTLKRNESNTEMMKLLPESVIRLEESRDCLDAGPSDGIVRRLQTDFQGLRQNQWRARLLAAAALTFAVVAGVALWLFFEQRRLSMVGIAQRLAAQSLNETQRLEHERAALLARQAYLFNKKNAGDAIARVDYALRTVLGSPTFNRSLPIDFMGWKRTQIRSIAYSSSDEVMAVAVNERVGIVRLGERAPVWRPLAHPTLQFPAIAMSPDGRRLAVAGSREGLLLYDLTAAKPNATVLPLADDRATSVAFGSDGSLLVAGTDHGAVYSWDLRSDLRARRIGEVPSGKQVYAIAVSGDSKALATAVDEGAIVLWDLEKGSQRALMKSGRSRSSRSLDFSPDGKWLAAASTFPAILRIWSMRNLEAAPVDHRLSGMLAVAFTFDGRALIAGNGLGQIFLWSADHLEQPPAVVNAHRDEIRALSAVPMTGSFVTGSHDGRVRVWNAATETEASFQWLRNGRVKPGLATLSRSNWEAYNVVSRSAVSRAGDGTLRLHRKLGGSEQVTPLDAGASSAAFSATGRFLAVGLPAGDESEEDSASDQAVVIRDLKSASHPVRMEWESPTTQVSTEKVRAVSLDSGLVELHQADEPAGPPAVLEPPGSRSAPALALAAEGRYLLMLSKPSERFNLDRTLQLQLVSTAALANEVCARVRRNLTHEEWRQFIGQPIPYEKTCENLPASP